MDYCDTSAFLKLILAEPESRVLRAALDPTAGLVSSVLLVVESRRAAMRYGTLAETRTRSALFDVTLVPVDDETIRVASELRPPGLRSLDAMHLATALSLGRDLENFYCYDTRLCDAANALGLRVSSPR